MAQPLLAILDKKRLARRNSGPFFVDRRGSRRVSAAWCKLGRTPSDKLITCLMEALSMFVLGHLRLRFKVKMK